jgi:hypothetical protein
VARLSSARNVRCGRHRPGVTCVACDEAKRGLGGKPDEHRGATRAGWAGRNVRAVELPGKQLAAGLVKPKAMAEKDFQRQVRDVAKRLGWDLAFHAMQPFHAAERGWPDLVLLRIRDRRLIFVELKAEKGKLSDRQTVVLDMLRAIEWPGVERRAAGGSALPSIEVHVWRPSDYDALVEVLR